MRVVILGLISPHAGRNRGGTAVSIVRLANHLLRRGVRVEIAALSTAFDQPIMQSLSAEIGLIRLQHRSRIAMLSTLVARFGRGAPDAIVSLDTRANTLATRFKRIPMLRRIAVVATLRNEMASKVGDGRSGPRKRREFERIFERADATVAISAGLADEFADVTGVARDRVYVLHNLVVDQATAKRGAAPVDHPWFADDRARPVILGAGRLAAQKGFDVLLEAFARLRRSRECRLVILGEGEDRDALLETTGRLGVGNDVDLPGFVGDPFPYMARCDVFAFPSRWEGFGNALAEALALGAPVVAADCPSGPREILEDGRHGELVPVDDAEALAAALGRTLDEPPPRARLVEAGQRFSVEACGDRYLRLLERLTGRGATAGGS